MPLLILQLLFLSSGGGIWEEIMEGFAWRKFNFQTALPMWALHRRSLRAPFFSRVLGGAFNKQLLRMGWWRIIRQTKSLLMLQARRRFQPWMNYFSSLLGTLIITMNWGWRLCLQDLARLSEMNPFFRLHICAFLSFSLLNKSIGQFIPMMKLYEMFFALFFLI